MILFAQQPEISHATFSQTILVGKVYRQGFTVASNRDTCAYTVLRELGK